MANKPTILVVDDTNIVLEATALTLNAFGFSVDRARRADEALSKYKTGEYAAILMDCHMPFKSGFECAQDIRTLEAQSGKHIPIIGFSSSNDRNIEAQCLNAGMDAFLAKDCSRQEMQEMVTQWAGTPESTGLKLNKSLVLSLGQIEAISEFFEGAQHPEVDVTLMAAIDERETVYFSIGIDFYKCDRLSPTKWRVINFDASQVTIQG
jgi:CheY-like chemotaxis protein